MTIDAEQIRESISRYEQFCHVYATRDDEDETNDAIRAYAIEYLGFTEEALSAFQEYIATDEEMRSTAAALGPVPVTLFVSGVMLGAAIVTEAREGEGATDVVVPDAPPKDL